MSDVVVDIGINLTIDALQRVILDDENRFRGRTFQAQSYIETMHGSRYGNHGDFVLYITGTEEQKDEYVMGVFANVTLIGCLLLVWSCVLVYCKCTGKLGWLAGIPPKRPSSPASVKECVIPEESCEDVVDDVEGSTKTGTQTSNKSNSSKVEDHVSSLEVREDAEDDGQGEDRTSDSLTDSKPQKEEFAEAGAKEGGNTGNSHSAKDVSEMMPSSPLCGKAVPVPADKVLADNNVSARSLSNDAALVLWEKEVQKVERKIRNCRIAVLVCGVIIIASSICLIALGFREINYLLDYTHQNLPILHQTIQKGEVTLADFIEKVAEARDKRVNFLNILCSFCPLKASKSGICGEVITNSSNFTITNSSNFTIGNSSFGTIANSSSDMIVLIDEALPVVEKVIKTVNSTLDDIFFIFYEEMNNVEKGVADVSNLVQQLDDSVTGIRSWWCIVAVTFVVLFDVMVIMFMVGVIQAWKDKQSRLFRDASTRYVLPIFVFFLLMSFVTCASCLLACTVLSDVCTTSPDQQLLRIIKAEAPTLFHRWAEHYIQACDPRTAPDLFPRLAQTLIKGIYAAVDLLASLTQWEADMYFATCGRNKSDVLDSARWVENLLEGVGNILNAIFKLTQCSKLNPIYTGLAYDTACDAGVKASLCVWVFLLVIVVFGMTILTLRIAWFEIEDAEDMQTGSVVGDDVAEKDSPIAGDDATNSQETAIQSQEGFCCEVSAVVDRYELRTSEEVISVA